MSGIPFSVYIIYTLIDPRDGEVRYVGITDNMARRFAQHLRETGARTAKGQWLEDLHTYGLKPLIKAIEEMHFEKAQRHLVEERERYWIRTFEQLGAELTNIRDATLGIEASFNHDRLIPTDKDDTILDTITPSNYYKPISNKTHVYHKQKVEKFTLDQLRIRAGLRVKELAKLSNIPESALHKMLRGQPVSRNLVFHVLYALSKHLKYEVTPNMVIGLKYS